MKKSTLSALLATVMTLASCGGAAQPSEDSTPPEETTEGVFENLTLKDFGGADFGVLLLDFNSAGYAVEEENGEILNDAIFARNRAVEEALNLNFDFIVKPGNWGDDQTAYQTLIRSSIMANSQDFDAVELYAACAGASIADKLFVNLHDVSTLRLDREWWCTLAVDELTVNGKLFTATGDIAISFWEAMQVMYFNKRLAEEYKLGSMYDLVSSGKWTIAKYEELIKDTARDLDGNSTWDKLDFYGSTVGDGLAINNFHTAFGVNLTKHNPDGSIELNINTEKFADICDRIYNLCKKNPDFFFGSGCNAMFTEGRAIFAQRWLGEAVTTFRGMEDDFGIIPVPKWDEAQIGYYTTVRDGRSMFAIPNDAKSADDSGLVLEALCTTSSELVVPTYYDVVLGDKILRDAESAEMLDIIRAGITIDFVAEYSSSLGNAGWILREIVEADGNSYSSLWAKHESKIDALFDKLLEAYE